MIEGLARRLAEGAIRLRKMVKDQPEIAECVLSRINPAPFTERLARAVIGPSLRCKDGPATGPILPAAAALRLGDHLREARLG